MRGIYDKIKIPFTNLCVIRWYPKAVTPIHGHNGQECNFFIIKGKLNETVYKNMKGNGYIMIYSNILERYTSSHINDTKGIHSIKNMDNQYAWSLHRYR